MGKKFIVAEVTKNWGKDTVIENTISMQFEEVINKNSERGYKLIEWKLNQIVSEGIFTETIIAIFEKVT